MMRSILVAGLVAVGATAALAQSNVIQERQALMKQNGQATRTVSGMLRARPDPGRHGPSIAAATPARPRRPRASAPRRGFDEQPALQVLANLAAHSRDRPLH